MSATPHLKEEILNIETEKLRRAQRVTLRIFLTREVRTFRGQVGAVEVE